jgi:hypothetical protein
LFTSWKPKAFFAILIPDQISTLFYFGLNPPYAGMLNCLLKKQPNFAEDYSSG